MKTIEIKSNNLHFMFRELQNEVGGTFTSNQKEIELKIDNNLGEGFIRGIELERNTVFIEFDVKFKEDTKFIIESPKQEVVNFLYCSSGKLKHAFNSSISPNKIETFQTGISANIKAEENHIYFYKDVYVNSTIISVNVSEKISAKYEINKMLSNLFISDRLEDYCYVGSFNLKIAESIKQLKAVKQEGVVRTLLIQGLVNVILAMEIEQHKLDIINSETNLALLTSNELTKVKELSDFINNYPETNLGVPELCGKIGLSPSKVQEGFKFIHGKTINSYIRFVRVQKSEELIKTTDLNISEIVYSLGFSSRSYFSRIFKERYNCSPIEYKQNNRLAATA